MHFKVRKSVFELFNIYFAFLGAEKEVIAEENLKDLKCELCEAIIDSIDKVIGTNATKQEVNETVYGVCGQLPGSLQALVSL